MTVGTDFPETFNRDNVELIDVKAMPIEGFTATGIIVGGREVPLDILIAASGFDALTGALTVIDVRGEDGQSLKEAWAHGPHTYLGISVRGFPNMYMIGGPGSPSVPVSYTHLDVYKRQHLHLRTSLPHIDADYAGSHWLASFALLALLAAG